MGAGCVDELDEGGARCDEKIGLLPCDPPRDVAAGEFVPVRITGAMDGELTGEAVE